MAYRQPCRHGPLAGSSRGVTSGLCSRGRSSLPGYPAGRAQHVTAQDNSAGPGLSRAESARPCPTTIDFRGWNRGGTQSLLPGLPQPVQDARGIDRHAGKNSGCDGSRTAACRVGRDPVQAEIAGIPCGRSPRIHGHRVGGSSSPGCRRARAGRSRVTVAGGLRAAVRIKRRTSGREPGKEDPPGRRTRFPAPQRGAWNTGRTASSLQAGIMAGHARCRSASADAEHTLPPALVLAGGACARDAARRPLSIDVAAGARPWPGPMAVVSPGRMRFRRHGESPMMNR